MGIRRIAGIIALIIALGLMLGCSTESEEPGAGSSTTTTDASQTGDPRPDSGDLEPTTCQPQPLSLPAGPLFADISTTSGIQDQNYDPDPEVTVPINDHSRLAFADLNGDGYSDIVMHSLFPNPLDAGIPFEHLVFHNNGEGAFENVSDASGLRWIQAGFFAFGDVDNDGDLDAFAGLDVPLGDETSQLLLNDGSGHFTPLAGSGVEGLAGQTLDANAVFADFDGDGVLDLFIGTGQTSYAAPDRLFFGVGDGTFTDGAVHLRGNASRASNGSVACDYDNDGDQDILVSVYGVSIENGRNFLYENDSTGDFVDVATIRGFDALATGNYWLASTGYGVDAESDGAPGTWVGSNGFGLQCEDVDNDGDMDVYITAISHPVDTDESRRWSDPTALLINQGPEGGYAFVNGFQGAGLPFNEGDVDGSMIDFDNDGLIDLATSRDNKYESAYTTEEQMAWFGLFHQQDDGSFTSVGLDSGINDPDDLDGWNRMKRAQNHAWSDIDRDGDLDLLVGGRTGSAGRPNFLFENLVGHENAWIALTLEGDGERVNRDAFGARVTVRFGEVVVMRELKSSRGMYNSIDGHALHLGLGRFADCAYTVDVRWPDGSLETFSASEVPLNQYTAIRYGAGVQ